MSTKAKNKVQNENNFKAWFNAHKKWCLTGGIVILVLLIGYFGGSVYYSGKYLPGTSINGIDVGGLNLTKAKEKVSQGVKDHQIVLKFNDGKNESINSSQLGLGYNENNTINKVLDKQSSFGWVGALMNSKDYAVKDVITVDEQALTSGLQSLEHMKAENQVAPTDAYVQYKDGKFSIAKETEGSTIQFDQLLNSVKTALANGKTTINVRKENCYVQPAVKEDNQDLKNKLSAANEYCKSVISYKTSSGKEFTLDGSVMLDWLTKKDDGTYVRDDSVFKENVLAFVKKMAVSYNTVNQSTTFKGSDGAMHTVTGGTYGIRVMPATETAEVMELIKQNKSDINRTPRTTGKSSSDENGGLGNTYVEVNITKQHMWFYKNGSCILQSDFVSGLESDPKRTTPNGAYYIYFKQRNRVLRGERNPDGTWPYEAPVKYWMAFNGGIGFHDLHRSAYGGEIYKTNGSHGCINLSESVAASLYASLDDNTPVIVYR